MTTKALVGTLAIAAASLFMTIPAAAQGRGQGRGPGHDRGEMMERGMRKLNLTDAQKAQIKQIREQFQAQNKGTLDEVRQLHEQMRQQRQSGDREGAQATREQIHTKMESLKPAREQMRQQIAALLTPEQKAEFEKMKAEHKGRRGGKGKRGDCHDKEGDGATRQRGNGAQQSQQGNQRIE